MLADHEKAVSCIAGGEVGANAEAAKGSNEGKVGGFKDIMGGSTGGASDLKGAACHCAPGQAGPPPRQARAGLGVLQQSLPHSVQRLFLQPVKPMACWQVAYTFTAMVLFVRCTVRMAARRPCLKTTCISSIMVGSYECGWYSVTLQPPQQLALLLKALIRDLLVPRR